MSATNQFPPPHVIPELDQESTDHHQSSSRGDTSQGETKDAQQQEQLLLPGPGEETTAPQQLDVSGADVVKHTIKFDNLGPLVVNKDGTLSRIHNWAQMTDAERERTVRVLGKRNMLRKEAILKEDDTPA